MNHPVHPGAEKTRMVKTSLVFLVVFLLVCYILLCLPMLFHPGDPVNTGKLPAKAGNKTTPTFYSCRRRGGGGERSSLIPRLLLLADPLGRLLCKRF